MSLPSREAASWSDKSILETLKELCSIKSGVRFLPDDESIVLMQHIEWEVRQIFRQMSIEIRLPSLTSSFYGGSRHEMRAAIDKRVCA